MNARTGDRCRPYCGVVADPGGVAAEPVDPVPIDPGLVMLDPLEPVVDPFDDRLCRERLVVVLVVPPMGIDPMVLPGDIPVVEPVGVLPVIPGAVEALPVPVDVPVVIDPLDPGAAPAPPDVWAPAAVASSAAAVIAIIVLIVILLGQPRSARRGVSRRRGARYAGGR